MKEKVSINDRSIESAGLPKDYKEALGELIWNGFDAGASRVEIEFEANEIDFVDQVIVRDNGSGIDYRNLPRTFGTLLDSLKSPAYHPQRSSYIHGQKGKGRFSFTNFARKAVWRTVCNPEGKTFTYDISIYSRSKDVYEVSEKKELPDKTASGTELILSNLFGVTAASFRSEEFIEFLCQQFGWFLFLNRKNRFALVINGEELNYSHLIAEYDVRALILDGEDEAWPFDLTFIRWKTRIGDRYYYYFLNQKKRECAKVLTSFNNNSIDFHHSVYIESDFFEDFSLDEEDPGSRLIGKNQSHPVYRSLMRELHNFLTEKESRFIRNESASRMLREFAVLGVIPEYPANKYDQARRQHLETVLQELYAMEPRIFKGLRREQQKLIVSLVDVALMSPERSALIQVLADVVALTDEDRSRIQNLMEQPALQRSHDALLQIRQRQEALAALQTLCAQESLFSAEKQRIHDLVAANCWMLDEAYHLAQPNPHSEAFLFDSLTMLDGKKRAGKSGAQQSHWAERPDVFVARRCLLPGADGGREENLLIELKGPGHVLGANDHRQAEAYLRYVLKDSQHNGEGQRWSFWFIVPAVDSYIREQYNAARGKGKPYLIQSLRSYDVYAITWRDILQQAALQHRYQLSRLPMERSALEQALQERGISV